MSAIGFDIGNESCVIAAAKRGGIDVLLNDESKRETPTVVSFGEKQRFLGCAGAAFATSNPKSTISQIKRLIGRLYKEPSVQEDLKLLPFATCEGPRGGVLIELEYLKKKWTFTPVEILGMLFTHLKQITEKNLESPVGDCVIGIPSYFTDLQRREYLDAASIAGLKPLLLMHDCTAIALGYGMYKTDLSNSRPTYVMFVDIGQCDTQVTVAGFKEGQMKILSHSFDQNLGGRDFDEVLFKHFAAKFHEQYKIDVYSNARASIRLRASCEKLKKVLSANAEAPISIECLIGDMDVKGFITRDEFENLSSELLERVTVVCIKALNDSHLTADRIYTIELVGSGSRIPAITRFLTSLFQKEPTRTLNASECVARGCALRCAMLSPTHVVRDYKFQDLFPYSVEISTDKHQLSLFPKGSLVPSLKEIQYHGKVPFCSRVFYTNETEFPAGISPEVGQFMIGPSQSSVEENVRVEFEVQLNKNGIVEIKSASILEDKRSLHRSLYSYMMGNSHMSDIPFSENLDVATTEFELHEAQEKEKMLAEQDMKVEQTKDQRNTLESFVYDTRSKLSSAYRSFATETEKDELTKSLQETEDWLYEDSDDESEQDYTGKLKDLQKLLEPIENKYKEENAIAKAVKALQTSIAKHRSLADSLPAGQKEKVKDLCNRAERVLNEISQGHSSSKRSSSYINEAIQAFESGCKSKMRPPLDSKKRDQRNTLKLFISETHSKLSSGYQNFITDSGKEVITNLLKETEDWLCKDTDDEFEPNYAGRLEYLKKVLEPIESKYKEEIARAKAAKDLQDFIATRRSIADSLPADLKEEVNNECNRAESWLSGISQKPKSPYNSSSYINQVIREFGSNCEYIIGPKSSFSKYDEPVDSNQREQPVDSNQSDQLVDSNQSDQPVDSNQSDQPVDSNESDQPVDSSKRDESVDSTKRDQSVDSNKRDQPVDSNKGDQPFGSKKDLPVGSKKDHPIYHPMGSNKRDQPVGLKKKDQSVGFNKTGQPMRSNKMNQPGHSNTGDQRMGSSKRDQTVKPKKRDEPTKSNKMKLMDSNKRDQHMDSNRRDQTVKSNKRDQPVDFIKSDQPVDSDQSDRRDDMDVDP